MKIKALHIIILLQKAFYSIKIQISGPIKRIQYSEAVFLDGYCQGRRESIVFSRLERFA